MDDEMTIERLKDALLEMFTINVNTRIYRVDGQEQFKYYGFTGPFAGFDLIAGFSESDMIQAIDLCVK